MTEDTFWLYEAFNHLEAAAWFIIAIVLPFRVARRSRKQNVIVFTASVTFIAFGFTDILEAPTHGDLPIWLWIYKFACAAILLACRYTYLGWCSFRLSDRYLLFAILCLAASVLAIFLPRILEKVLA
jgi:hypothetical protein